MWHVGPRFFPLDEELGLLPGTLSPGLQQAVVWLGASLPFGQVPPIIKVLAGVRIGAATVRRYTERAGAALVTIQEERVRDIEGTLPADPVGAARQQLSVDGAMVPIRGGEWREVKTAAIGVLSATKPGKTQALSYVSRMQEIDRFAWVATGELHRRGTFAAEQVVAVVDGAVWCQHFIDYHCPDAVRVLDLPHVVEHLSQAAQTCFGSGTAQTSEWLVQQRQTLLGGDPQTVVAAVMALPVGGATDPIAAAQVRDQVVAYLQPRLAQMTYATFLAQGFPIASGVVESANKLVVEARLKGAGMHWAAANVDPLLALRCAICSHRWDACWQQIRDHLRRPPRRRLSLPAAVTSPVTATVVLPEPPARTTHPCPPRAKTIVNGKPTTDHPWRKPFLFPAQKRETGITQK